MKWMGELVNEKVDEVVDGDHQTENMPVLSGRPVDQSFVFYCSTTSFYLIL